MNTIVPFHKKAPEKTLQEKKELFELVNYLLDLEENSFTGQVKIDFERGSVNRVAFNQKIRTCHSLFANE
ncbi:MAG: hypothetical protein H8E41_01090 [Desulfobulbaceae bacterium]|uniref:Uncharacterized protein n=1 Tax=Candidatus Desulfobia pelagia TaxID=2841692 RepID=A0A8J6NB58_9BACT|nr:hypothetical protein [Candidatus Desulfobia pelagia]